MIEPLAAMVELLVPPLAIDNTPEVMASAEMAILLVELAVIKP